jgi:hypothetical protein
MTPDIIIIILLLNEWTEKIHPIQIMVQPWTIILFYNHKYPEYSDICHKYISHIKFEIWQKRRPIYLDESFFNNLNIKSA